MGNRHEAGSRSRQLNAGYDDYRRRITARIAATRGVRVPPGTIEHLLQTPVTFETWLRSQPSDAIVGNYFTPDDSPLANFIWDSLGVYVDTGDFIFDGERFYELHELPEWCSAYTRHEDQYVEQGRRDGRFEFTAAEVLDILRGAVGSG